MTWLWILLRCLFPADPIRQTAEAMRHRMAQLIHIARDESQLTELLINPALRLHLEQLILDTEDCLRLWIAMRGHQIARIRPRLPRDRATPNLTHAKDLLHLLARIAALADECDHMEQRAQSHAQKLRQLRDADPLDVRTSCGPHRHASHATFPAFGEGGRALSSTSEASGGGATRSVVTEGAARSADAVPTRGASHSIAGANR